MYVLTRSDDVFLFDDYSYLFHITNLTSIYTRYKQVLKKLQTYNGRINLDKKNRNLNATTKRA